MALSTFLAILIYCRLPDVLRKVGYDPRFSVDKFGIAVGAEGRQVSEVKEMLRRGGADEVEVRDGI